MSLQQQIVLSHSSPSELLHYNEKYQVLICIKCEYAIQPSALSRHLKDIHQIYRGARRPYVDYARGLTLATRAVVPSIDDFPIPYLALYKGYRCEARGCDYLCLSAKRMEMHWPAAHNCKGEAARDWSRVPLQSFFRGTMLRYFAGPRSLPPGHNMNLPKCGERFWKPSNISVQDALRVAYQLDELDALILEHYFSDSHKCFLINSDAEHAWLSTVPQIALKYDFVLYGILAFAAQHMCVVKHKRQSEIAIRQLTHKDIAFPALRNTIDNTDAGSAEAILAFSHLLTIMSLGSEAGYPRVDKADHLMLVRSADAQDRLVVPQWLALLRSSCPILRPFADSLMRGKLGAVAADLHRDPVGSWESHPCYQRFLSYIPHDGSWDDHTISVFRSSAQALVMAAMISDEEVAASVAGSPFEQGFSLLSKFSMRVKDDFFVLLSMNHPAALIIMGWYCALLKRVDHKWFLMGRVEQMYSDIELTLGPRWRPCLEGALAFMDYHNPMPQHESLFSSLDACLVKS
ncbi:hypothetical protein LIA77_11095 [Sarocladium implicatum]|nr:hypothetical protein LIA77_11095 [Sarocladium implicatum]